MTLITVKPMDDEQVDIKIQHVFTLRHSLARDWAGVAIQEKEHSIMVSARHVLQLIILLIADLMLSIWSSSLNWTIHERCHLTAEICFCCRQTIAKEESRLKVDCELRKSQEKPFVDWQAKVCSGFHGNGPVVMTAECSENVFFAW